MKFTLLLYIANCVGPTCDIPDYETKYFDTEIKCEEVREIWLNLKTDNRGYCLNSYIEYKPVTNWNVENE